MSSSLVKNLLFGVRCLTHLCFSIPCSLIDVPSALQTYVFHKSELDSYWSPSAFALVTGATDGLGLALATQLASRGWNVILHGRNPAKLTAVLTRLQKAYPTQTFHTLLADAHSRTLDFPALLQPFSSLTITLLINNVGGNPDAVAIPSLSAARFDDIVHCNALFSVHLTHAALPLLHPSHACILSISSVCAAIPSTTTGVYSASKAFLVSFMACLRLALEAQGTEVLCINMASVQTHLIQMERTIMTPTADEFARGVLSRVGLGKGAGAADMVYGHTPHAIVFGWFFGCLDNEARVYGWDAYCRYIQKMLRPGFAEG